MTTMAMACLRAAAWAAWTCKSLNAGCRTDSVTSDLYADRMDGSWRKPRSNLKTRSKTPHFRALFKPRFGGVFFALGVLLRK